nr:helix-hairpin-helix domain-containing protein [Enterococcus gallinarum]
MEELQKIPNVGKVLAEHLHAIGIDSVEKMKSATAETIFMRIRTGSRGLSTHALWD